MSREKLQPALRLPYETTSEIFIHCLPDLQHAESIFNLSASPLPTALLLSQICRAWRGVAMNTPKIWAIFRIDFEAWPKNRARALGARRLAHWVERSGVSPLSVALEWRDSCPTTMLIFVSRTRNLASSKKHFLSSLHESLPNLDTLQLTSDDEDASTPITAFELAPSLRRASLNQLAPNTILFPWHQLTHFTTETSYGEACLGVLQLAVSLVDCKFRWVRQHFHGEITETTLLPCHPDLKVLHLVGYDVCSSIIGLATLPSLVELNYADHNPPKLQHYEHFVDFLSRSRPPLLRLTLFDGTYSRIPRAFPFLIHLTSLELLRLSAAEMSDFSHDLVVRDQASFLPNLESVTSSAWPIVDYYGPPKPPETAEDINYGDWQMALSQGGRELTRILDSNSSG
ncbi:F-box domain-containing protein [Mycena sanguinolenta]|uniref:F-box domain-containing protein n=1 Tax=Mycena sanguinolenta TaxID=230812 RepID=A0A8H7D0I4_9AGAR|nr:F-box domain-containing protein [Mycena sanguinolenta]